MKILKRILVILLKRLDLGSAVAVRLTKMTGKSSVPLHPKHLLTQNPWFTKYLNKNDTVIDLGCGNGQNSIKASNFVARIVAVDFDANLLRIAKESAEKARVKNVQFELVDLEKKLKYKNNAFTKVILLDVLEHLNNRGQILSEVRRILKPNELLFLGVPSLKTSWKLLQQSLGICPYSDPDHKIEFTQDSIKKLLAKNGFAIIHFGYGKYDTPFRGLFDIIGGFSISFYREISDVRQEMVRKNPQEASGFEIIAINIK